MTPVLAKMSTNRRLTLGEMEDHLTTQTHTNKTALEDRLIKQNNKIAINAHHINGSSMLHL